MGNAQKDYYFKTQAEYSRYRGVSKKTVTIWKQQGRIKLINGFVDVVASNKMLAGRPEVYRGGRVTPFPPDGKQVRTPVY